jgi:hypothetical protein
MAEAFGAAVHPLVTARGAGRNASESKVEEGHLMPDHVHMLLSRNTRFRRWSAYQGR